MSPCSLLSL